MYDADQIMNFIISTKCKISEWKISPHSSLSFHYSEGRWISWRCWVTLHLQLIHKIPFFKTSFRQFDLFLYIYGKKYFRKINIFFSHACFLSNSFSSLRSPSWGVIPETGKANEMANLANLYLGFQSCVRSRMAYTEMVTGNFTNARDLTVTHLLHVVIRTIKNWIVKLLTSPKISWNQADECMSALSHLGLVKVLTSLKN